MADLTEPTAPQTGDAIARLRALATFAGPPKTFWPEYLAAVAALTGAHRTALYLASTAEDAPGTWSKLADASTSNRAPISAIARSIDAAVSTIADRTPPETGATLPLESLATGTKTSYPPEGYTVIAFYPRLSGDDQPASLVVSVLSPLTGSTEKDALLHCQLAADTPAHYQRNLAAARASADVTKLAGALDIAVQVNQVDRFRACAIAFCNAAATQFEADRASLGWLHGGFLKLEAISRTEKFERKSEAAQLLEAAMEESFDQDDEIVWPPDDDSPTISRDHARFAEDNGIAHAVSLPLRLDGSPIGCLLLERDSAPFSDTDVRQLRLACDVSARRLADLRKRDRWFGARAAASLKESAAKLLGPKHTVAKLVAAVLAITVLALVFVKVPYRVEANFIVRSDQVGYLSAPFDSYIETVAVRTGDAVSQGTLLLSLNRTDLELERSSAVADLARYQREAQKARATNRLAELRVADALAEQAQARLALVDHRLAQTDLTAPFNAIVVEGDQRERLGAPIAQGDVLFKLARTDSLYVEAEIDQADIHEITADTSGEIAFVSRPGEQVPISITQVVPAAVAKNQQNVFRARCTFESPPADWWKPGMGGVAKFDVEDRSLGWVLTHRTSDFLRMLLWW